MVARSYRSLVAALLLVLLNFSTIESTSLFPHKIFLKKLASLSTVLLLTGSTIASADSTRIVGDITTSGIVFKDTLKITGQIFMVTFCGVSDLIIMEISQYGCEFKSCC